MCEKSIAEQLKNEAKQMGGACVMHTIKVPQNYFSFISNSYQSIVCLVVLELDFKVDVRTMLEKPVCRAK